MPVPRLNRGIRSARQVRQVRQGRSRRGPVQSEQPILLRLDAAQPPARCALPQAPSFFIHTNRERLTLSRLTQPKWASAIGRNRFGLWSEIAIETGQGEPVIQRLRWIPPGRFWMGSPESELEDW